MTFVATSTLNRPLIKSYRKLFPDGYSCSRNCNYDRDKAFAYEQLVYLYALYAARLTDAGLTHKPRVFVSDWIRKVVSSDLTSRRYLTSVCYDLIDDGSVVSNGLFVYLEVDYES